MGGHGVQIRHHQCRGRSHQTGSLMDDFPDGISGSRVHNPVRRTGCMRSDGAREHVGWLRSQTEPAALPGMEWRRKPHIGCPMD